MDPLRERLAERMATRAAQLHLPWSEVARRADMTPQNLLRIRQGDITVTSKAATGIDDALLWEDGSVFAILAGGEPTPRRKAGTTVEGEGIPRLVLLDPDDIAGIAVDLMREGRLEEAKTLLSTAFKVREAWAKNSRATLRRAVETADDQAG